MKLNLIKYTAATLAVTCMLQACTKQAETILSSAENASFDNSTVAQVFVATVNASRNYVYVDGNQVTGALLSSGSIFPATGYGFKIGAGNRAFLVRDTLRTSTQVPLSFGNNMQFGKHYTIFTYDTINSPKQKTVEDNIVIPADTSARLRFANFVFSKTAVPNVDIYSKRRNTNLFTNVAVTDVTNYIPVPSAFNDTFYVRETGTLTQLAALNGLNPTQKRSYTLVFRGRYQTTSGTVARTLSSFANY